MATIEHCHNIEDLRTLARKRLPGTFVDYMEGGAEDERTLYRNLAAFGELQFVPRVLVDVSDVKLDCELFGAPAAMPVVMAPTGMTRMFQHEGELAVARAAGAFGVPYTLSTVATTSIEEIGAVAVRKAFQIYVWNDMAIVDNLVDRCRAQGYDTLMLAVDSPTLGNRERDVRNGHGRPVAMRLRVARQALLRPTWLYNFVTRGPKALANLTEFLPPGENLFKSLDKIHGQFDPRVGWDAIERLRDRWQGPLVLKGIQSVGDAQKAKERGVDGIVLSNHGGRQLDDAPPCIELLPRVVAAVDGGMDIYVDGGVRRGSDIVKAVALGAKAVLIGRPYLYGLVTGGEAGVTRALQILHDEMVRVMMLIGCPSLDALDASYVEPIAAVAQGARHHG